MKRDFKADRRKDVRSAGKQIRSNRWVWGKRMNFTSKDQMKRIALTAVAELEAANEASQIKPQKISIPRKTLAQLICKKGRGIWQRPESLQRGLCSVMKEIRPSFKRKRERGLIGTEIIFEWNPKPTTHHVRKQKSPQGQKDRVLRAKVIE